MCVVMVQCTSKLSKTSKLMTSVNNDLNSVTEIQMTLYVKLKKT